MKIEHRKVDQAVLRAEMLEGGFGEAARLSATFLSNSATWHRLATNSIATSCKDASARRWRLGKEGIALHSELKSIAFAGTDTIGELVIVAHCNGDLELDESQIGRMFGLLSEIRKADLSTQLGDIYGLVNPFNIASLLPGTRIRQVFDQTLLDAPPPSQTMMTNGGHRNVGVEFRVKDIVRALGEAALVGKISHENESLSVQKLVFVSGGDGYAAFRFAKAVQDSVNERAGVRAGTGFGGLPMEVRVVPGLAATKSMREYSEIVADAVPWRAMTENSANSLIVPCTLGVETALRESGKELRIFSLSDCVFSGRADLPVAGAKNDFDSLALLDRRFEFDHGKHFAHDFMEDLDWELGVKMTNLNVTQKMYEAFGRTNTFQINLNLWYYINELAGSRAKSNLGPKISHLHDLAATQLARRASNSYLDTDTN